MYERDQPDLFLRRCYSEPACKCEQGYHQQIQQDAGLRTTSRVEKLRHDRSLAADWDAHARDLNALEDLVSDCCGSSITDIAEQTLAMKQGLKQELEQFLTDIIVACNTCLSRRGVDDEDAQIVTTSLLHWIAFTRAAIRRRRNGTLS